MLQTAVRIVTMTTVLAALPAFGQSSMDDARSVHARGAAAFRLAHSAEDTWQAARDSGDRRFEDVELRALALAGAARIATGRLERHDTSRDEVRSLVGSLERLARDAQDALDRAPRGGTVQDSWGQTRRALARLQDVVAGRLGPDDDAGTPSPTPEAGTSQPPTPSVADPPDPDAPRIQIEVRWTRSFTPDLKLDGRLEGRGLKRARLVVFDSSGREIYSDDTTLNDAIQRTFADLPNDALATVLWNGRIGNDQLGSGDNRIVITLEDQQGRTATEEQTVAKRLF